MHLLVLAVVVTAASAVPFRADYPIDSIAQNEGTRLKGTTTSELVGWSVAGGGDVDGDGVIDFVVGTWSVMSLSEGAMAQAGQAYVLYGVANASDAAASAWPTDTTIKAITQDSTRGRIIDGAATSTCLGTAVAIVGDVNGDRLDDIAIGSP
jgi:hypothetical protein